MLIDSFAEDCYLIFFFYHSLACKTSNIHYLGPNFLIDFMNFVDHVENTEPKTKTICLCRNWVVFLERKSKTSLKVEEKKIGFLLVAKKYPDKVHQHKDGI